MGRIDWEVHRHLNDQLQQRARSQCCIYSIVLKPSTYSLLDNPYLVYIYTSPNPQDPHTLLPSPNPWNPQKLAPVFAARSQNYLAKQFFHTILYEPCESIVDQIRLQCLRIPSINPSSHHYAQDCQNPPKWLQRVFSISNLHIPGPLTLTIQGWPHPPSAHQHPSFPALSSFSPATRTTAPLAES